MTRKEALALPAGGALDSLVAEVPWVEAALRLAPEKVGDLHVDPTWFCPSRVMADTFWLLETWRLLSRSVCLNDGPAENWTRYHTELQSYDPGTELMNAWFVGLWKVNDGMRRAGDAIGHDAIGFGQTLPLAVARAVVCTTIEREEPACASALT